MEKKLLHLPGVKEKLERFQALIAAARPLERELMALKRRYHRKPVEGTPRKRREIHPLSREVRYQQYEDGLKTASFREDGTLIMKQTCNQQGWKWAHYYGWVLKHHPELVSRLPTRNSP